MNCERTRARIGAWVDGQLDPAEASELATHVATCNACRAEVESLRGLHDDLVRAFAAPREAAARLADRVALAAGSPVDAPVLDQLPTRRDTGGRVASDIRRRWPNVFSLALAMAIGFLLAVVIFRPWKSPRAVSNGGGLSPSQSVENLPSETNTGRPDPSIARLVAATRSMGVECVGPDRKDWKPVAEIANFQCPTDGGVRTDDKARCELVTSDGCVVRMNSGTEIIVHSPARIELRRGEIWCRSTAAAPLEVVPHLSSAVVEQAAAGGQPFRCMASDAACFLRIAKTGDKVSVTAQTGKVDVKAHDKNLELAARESAIITNEQVRRDHSSDALLRSSWMQPLLIRKGHANSELVERVNDLLARVGETKQPELYETEIRSLGEYSVLPLLRYVESPRSDANPWRREAAMRIISDLAPAWAIGDLVGLLKHSDAGVRSLAAAALTRLTQQTQGIAPGTWRGDPAKWQPAAAVWQTWWSKNGDRFPHLPEAQQP